MTSMQTGIAMAGAMATIAEETAVELGSGIHLGANKCSKDIVFIGSSWVLWTKLVWECFVKTVQSSFISCHISL